MLRRIGGFFLLVAMGGTSSFGCDSPPPDSGAAGLGGLPGVSGMSSLGGTNTSLGATGTTGTANTGGSPTTGGTSAAHQAADAGPGGPCVSQGTLDNDLTPVRGTIRGPRVDGVLCDKGVGTSFGYNAVTGFTEDLQTAMVLSDPRPDDFVFSAPTNVLFASLSGYASATAAAIGTYASTDNCGWLKLELTFPIPSGVACTSPLAPCDPGCEPTNGEMGLCEPARPRRYYNALPSIQCTLGEPPLGEWQLTLTSVSIGMAASGTNDYQTHGRLSATLISETDPSDSVQLDLEF